MRTARSKPRANVADRDRSEPSLVKHRMVPLARDTLTGLRTSSNTDLVAEAEALTGALAPTTRQGAPTRR